MSGAILAPDKKMEGGDQIFRHYAAMSAKGIRLALFCFFVGLN
jgi:hypothetical protein